MKQYKINNAYPILAKIVNFDMPIAKAKAIYHLTKLIDEHYQFAVERERKIIADMGGVIQDNGSVKFKSEDDVKLFTEKINEMNNMEVEIEYSPIYLSEQDIGEQRLKPSEIFSIEDFVVFD